MEKADVESHAWKQTLNIGRSGAPCRAPIYITTPKGGEANKATDIRHTVARRMDVHLPGVHHQPSDRLDHLCQGLWQEGLPNPGKDRARGKGLDLTV